jgi:hypothetical protein
MKLTFSLLLALSTSAAARVIKRQSGPVEPDTDKDCTYYDDALDSSYDCQYFEDWWGMAHEDFVAWVSIHS